MEDMEPEIFTKVAAELRKQFTGIYVIGEYTDAPAQFPCATISEQNNTVYTKSQDSGSIENHSTLLYEVNTYSNKTSGRKAQAKAIAYAADAVMASMGFTRTFLQPTPNVSDATVFRYTGRYVGVLDNKTKEIYRG